MDFVVKAIAEKLAGLGGRPALRGAGRKRTARRVECPREHSGRNRGGKPDILLSAFEQVATSCVACAVEESAGTGRHLSVPTASSFPAPHTAGIRELTSLRGRNLLEMLYLHHHREHVPDVEAR